MAAPLKPQKAPSSKKDTWWFAPAVADMAAPTDGEINAITGLNFTCYLLADQAGLSATPNKVSLPKLLCEDGTTEVTENITRALGDIVSAFDPQAATGSTGKKTWDLFKSGVSGYLIRRQNVVNDTDASVTAGQFVDVFKVDVKEATNDKSATDASGIYVFTCPVDLVDQELNVAVVAES